MRLPKWKLVSKKIVVNSLVVHLLKILSAPIDHNWHKYCNFSGKNCVDCNYYISVAIVHRNFATIVKGTLFATSINVLYQTIFFLRYSKKIFLLLMRFLSAISLTITQLINCIIKKWRSRKCPKSFLWHFVDFQYFTTVTILISKLWQLWQYLIVLWCVMVFQNFHSLVVWSKTRIVESGWNVKILFKIDIKKVIIFFKTIATFAIGVATIAYLTGYLTH